MKKITSPKTLALLGTVVIIIIGVFIALSFSTKKTETPTVVNNSGDCSQYSHKDGYTGCQSIKNGKEHKCKFKVENKINPTTQKMEFNYLCLQK